MTDFFVDNQQNTFLSLKKNFRTIGARYLSRFVFPNLDLDLGLGLAFQDQDRDREQSATGVPHSKPLRVCYVSVT